MAAAYRKPRLYPWSTALQWSTLQTTQTLLSKLWLLPTPLYTYQQRSYRKHLANCQRVHIDRTIPCTSCNEILKLKDELGSLASEDLDEIYNRIGHEYASSNGVPSDASIHRALQFAIRLWLFVPLDEELLRGFDTLPMIIERRLRAVGATQGPAETLSDDFSQMTLSRIGGLRLVWTSDISRHLVLEDEYLYCFQHGAALAALMSDSSA